MTKAEKIEMLEAQLKAARFELEIAKDTISKFRKKEEFMVFAVRGTSGYDVEGYYENLTIRLCPAPYSAGVLDCAGFHKAIGQFLDKWNEAVREATENQFKQASAANVPRGED